ncbi:MAG: S8 family serine peptidase [Armatimonadota bacterium]
MNYFIRTSSVIALGLALASVSSAIQFTSIPRVREFTGQLIVRPLQIDAMLDQNWSASKIAGEKARVQDRFKFNTVRYHPETDEYVVKVPSGKNESTYATELLATGDFQYATPNWMLYPVADSNDPLFPQQWHHFKIQSPQAWNSWTGGSNFEVTFIDTGILKTHVDLKDLLLEGYNSVDRKTESEGGDINDINGHGTHVSGCGAAHGNNGIGVSGVGWNFKIRFVRTSNSPSGGAAFDDILSGARWAVDHGSKTMSASYSGVDFPEVGVTGTYVKSKGGLFLYAAGNDNRDLSGFTYADTIVCGASNENDGKAGFSAYGKGVNVFAPGTNILSTTMDGGYGRASGTSMATPVTNGALATIWSANPTLTPDEAQEILYSTCDNIGPKAIFGNGRINVDKGVQLALSTLARDTTISDVNVQTGSHAAGNLGSVQDANLENAFKVDSGNFGAMGTIAASNMTVSLPTDQGTITGFTFSATCRVTGTLPTSIFAYALNLNTNKYDLLTTKGTIPGLDKVLNFRLSKDVSKYISGDGSVKVILRSVVPKRFGTTPNQLSIGYAKARYSIRPSF